MRMRPQRLHFSSNPCGPIFASNCPHCSAFHGDCVQERISCSSLRRVVGVLRFFVLRYEEDLVLTGKNVRRGRN